MFKSGGLFSLLFAKKSSSVSDGEVPSSFTMNNGNNRLLNVQMKQYDDFVDIDVNPMTYAEVAQLSQDKPLTSLVSAPAPPKTAKPAPLADSFHEDEVIEEKFKSGIHYQKHREYKKAQKKKKAKQGKKRF